MEANKDSKKCAVVFGKEDAKRAHEKGEGETDKTGLDGQKGKFEKIIIDNFN